MFQYWVLHGSSSSSSSPPSSSSSISLQSICPSMIYQTYFIIYLHAALQSTVSTSRLAYEYRFQSPAVLCNNNTSSSSSSSSSQLLRLSAKLHITSIDHINSTTCCTTNLPHRKFAMPERPTSRHIKMLGCGKFLSVGGEYVVQQVVELLWARPMVVLYSMSVAGVRVVEFGINAAVAVATTTTLLLHYNKNNY